MWKPRGQVSIFLIFIFHILFIFFAMVINVGMLVHHKINLQNSVDLAAYYGAMKQSEILGAIAHSNYQIRQSWKLMNYRYHMLGGLGRDSHPKYPQNPAPDQKPEFASVFCITEDTIFKTRISINSNQTTCRSTTPKIAIAAMKVPKFVGAIAMHQNISKAIQKAKDQADEDFITAGARNFKLLSLFITLYRADVKNRKMLINELASQISKTDEDFNDLDGNSTEAGAYKTLFNNLTEDNKNANFKFYNSMGHGNCRRKDNPIYPPFWLRQITVMPTYIYYDSYLNLDDDSQRYSAGFAPLIALPIEIDRLNLDNDERVLLETMRDLSDPNQRPELNFFDIAGVEKNPWCLTYVGVTAVATPSLPFMPSSIPIGITASAYAKPFGGKIGPWYKNSWSQNSDMSDGGSKIDATLPIRYEDTNTRSSSKAEDYRERMPNYARYPGDTDGIISLQAQKAHGLVIQKINEGKHIIFNTKTWINKTKSLMQSQSNLNTGLPFMPTNLDILAEEGIDSETNLPLDGAKELRELETIAIAPDLFDITYYSIEPNFNDLYLEKLKALFPEYFPRGDLGSSTNKIFSIIDQMNVVGNNSTLDFSQNGLYQIVYKSNPTDDNDPIWGRVLTNWGEKSLLDYSIDQVSGARMFGHCKEPIPRDLQKSNPTQGECLTGGRTGYSVKLVSKKYLTRGNLSLGGASTSGAALNPPPDNFDY